MEGVVMMMMDAIVITLSFLFFIYCLVEGFRELLRRP